MSGKKTILIVDDEASIRGFLHRRLSREDSQCQEASSVNWALETEFQDVKRHCEIGDRILTPIADDEDINRMVRHHHELYDGTGYPDGLKGECIPLDARVLAVADTFDAMTSSRSYRSAVSVDEALSEIGKCAGTQFDPAVVAAFLKIPAAEIVKAEVPAP